MKKNTIQKGVKCSLLMLGLLFMSMNIHAEQKTSALQAAEHPGLNNTQQNVRKVTGIVEDKDGLSIIGASVQIKGSTKGTITDIDGKYEIEVAEGTTLVFTYIGFVKQEIAVAGQQTVNVVMSEDAKALDEVVVIGYGSQRKQDLSMSISTVKIDESMKSGPSNFATMMQGRMAGVTFQMGGGDPLGEATLSIRGRGSRGLDTELGQRSSKGVNNNASSGDGVLYVVDGVPNAPFNVEDIETVTVLKDAASAAIYGASVGSGGVIVITTKKGQSGKIKVSVNASNSIRKVTNVPSVLNADQYNKVWADAVKFANERGTPASLPSVADSNLYPYGAVTRTDWLDEIFRTGYLQHYALSLTGGSESMRSSFSVSYDKNEGILLNTYSEKFGGKLNIEYDITKWLTFRENATFQYSNAQGDVGRTHEGPLIGAVLYPRSATIYEYEQNGTPVYDKFGQQVYGGTIPTWAQGSVSGYGALRNPVAQLKRMRQHRPAMTLYSTSTIELKPLRGLSIRSDFTAGWNPERYEQFNSRVPEYGHADNLNARFIASSWNTSWLWENSATYSFEPIERHNFSLMGGTTMKHDNYRWNDVWTSGYDREDELSTIFPGATEWTKIKPDELIWSERLTSVFGRLSYSFDDRYFLTGSLRRDATSKLYKKKNSGTFAAASGAWKISSEPFFKNLEWDFVNLFKIRGSFGQVGNVKLVRHNSYEVLIESDRKAIIFGENLDQQVYGTSQTSPANRDLIWETTDQYGAGLDLLFLNNSLEINVDYFYKKTKDLIETSRPTVTAGITTSPKGNIGNVINKGWEFQLSYKNKIDKLDYNVYANLATVNSKVKDLGGLDFMAHDEGVNSLKPLRSTPGQPWYSFYLTEVAGIFQTQEEVSNYLFKDPITGEAKPIQPNAQPGDFKYVDFNKDGKIDDDDKQYKGSYLPKMTYAFGANLNYNNFDFSFMFQGIAGNKIFNGFKQMGLSGRMVEANMLSDILKSWEYNPNSGFPRLAIAGDAQGNYSKLSTFYLESGSYLRLKSLTLGYTLPAKTMNSIGLPSNALRFYMNAENLLTITPYSGIDPEVGYFGIDSSTYPLARSFSLGVNFNF